jgi:hypothetical protein
LGAGSHIALRRRDHSFQQPVGSKSASEEFIMSKVVERAMAWSGLVVIVLTLSGFTLARLLPVPPGANLDPAQIAQFYGAHPIPTRLGFLLATIGLAFLAPMAASIAMAMLRIKAAPPVLALLQVIGGVGVVMLTVIPTILMNVAAFRPDRNPMVTQAISDVAWLLFVTPIPLFFFQEVPIAVAILMDRSPRPVFPRWVGYANLWIPLTFLPALLPYFFKTGPLAWQGLLVFYLGLATFGAWVVVMMWALLNANRRQAEDGEAHGRV